MSTFARLALALRDNGYDPLPIVPREKRPAMPGWQKPASDSQLAGWVERHPDHGVGILCGALVAIDIDVLDAAAAARLEGLAVEICGPTPLVRISQAPKRLLLYRGSERFPSTSIKLTVGGIDILGMGRQFVAYGIHPKTGQAYIWRDGGEPFDTPLDALPQLSPRQLKALLYQALNLYASAPEQPPLSSVPRAIGNAKRTKPRRRDSSRSAGRPVPVRDETTGLIIDGRDQHLANLIYAAWSANTHAAAEDVARVAWEGFERTADLSLPKHDGGGPGHWSPDDAIRKARAIVARGAQGALLPGTRLRPHQPGEDISEALARVFGEHCRDRLIAKTDSAIRVSNFMVERLKGGACIDSVGFIAEALGLTGRTVERARPRMVSDKPWISGRRMGTRDQMAPYRPRPRILAQLSKIIEKSSDVATEATPQLSPNHINNVVGVGGDRVSPGGWPCFPASVCRPSSPALRCSATLMAATGGWRRGASYRAGWLVSRCDAASREGGVGREKAAAGLDGGAARA